MSLTDVLQLTRIQKLCEKAVKQLKQLDRDKFPPRHDDAYIQGRGELAQEILEMLDE